MLFLEAVESGPVGRLVIAPSSSYAVHGMERGCIEGWAASLANPKP